MAITSIFPSGNSGKKINDATITLVQNNFVYDGIKKTQQVSSVVLNGTILTQNTDYVVVGNRATNAGTYTLSVLGTGRYSGTASSSWSIAKAQGSIEVGTSSMSLQGEGAEETAELSVVGDGTVKASSSNSSVAITRIEENRVCVECVGSGEASITVTLGEGTNYLGASCQIAVACSIVHIYGVSWDGTSTTACTRTDDAANFTDPVPYVAGATEYGSPFDNRLPWSGMQIVEDAEAGTLVSIPKFWYTLTQNGAGMKIQIADAELDGFHVSPAHMDRGDGKGERDVVYIARYHCASDYKSKTGVTPVASKTRSAFRSSIHALGSTIWQADWAMRFTIFLLYLVEFADWNSQDKIGRGCSQTSSSSSAVFNMGYTDSMPYHTGTTQTSRTSYGGTQYRWIEGLWDNCYDWLDGCYNSSSGLNLILDPSKFSDSANGTSVGKPSSGGYPSAFSVKNVNGFFPLFLPSAANGSDSTYSCDRWGFDSSGPCVFAGGGYSQYLSHGLFYWNCISASSTVGGLGSRSMKLP